jgi:Tol biopolymer transport system component
MWYQGLSKKRKIIFTVFVSTIFLLGVFSLAAFVLKLDSLVFPSELNGSITQYTGDPVEDARICVGKKCSSSDPEGQYSLKGLTYGKREVSVSKDGFETIKEDVKIKRGQNTKNFELKIPGTKNISGQLSLSTGKLITENFQLISADEYYDIEVAQDRSFTVKNVELSGSTLEIHSPNYIDLSFEVNPADDEINIGSVSLSPAGDVSFKPVDFLTQDFLDGLKVEPASEGGKLQVYTKDEKTYVEDLKVGEAIEFNITKDDYNTKAVKVTSLKQGENNQGQLDIVREGKVVYVSNRTGNQNVYIANYDGSAEKMLTGNKGDNYAPYYAADQGIVYFLSDRDKVKNDDGQVMDLAYKVDVGTQVVTKVTKTNYDETGNIGVYNLKAQRRLTSREHPDFPNTWQFFFSNIDGTGVKQVFHSADNLYNFVISDSGNLLMYRGSYSDSTKDGVYLYNTQSGKQNRIYETSDDASAEPTVISADSNYGLLRVYKSGQSDLVVRDFGVGKSTQITASTSYELSARFSPDNEISFMSTRDEQSDLYLVDLDGGNETRITRDGKVSNYLWSDAYILYTSENSLWIIDPDSPEKARKVSDNGQLSYYASFGQDYYGWD